MVSITTLASFNIYNALEECIEDELEDFNDAPFPVELDPVWCKRGIISTILGREYCCAEKDCKDYCEKTYPDFDGDNCCTMQFPCNIGTCRSVDKVVCRINPDITALITIPDSNLCKDVALSYQGFLESQYPDTSSETITNVLEDWGDDIGRAFKCLYYFYFVAEFGVNRKCDKLGFGFNPQGFECNDCTADLPIFDLTGFTVDSQIVVLPSRQDRRTGASDKGKYGMCGKYC